MRRRAIATIWIAGSTVPILLATVFLFGCCILPLHHIAHKLMPVCDLAASLMRGEADGHDHEHEAAPPAAPEKQEPAKRAVTTFPRVLRLEEPAAPVSGLGPASATAFRSFITLGAVRCDQDVGLFGLVETYLI